MKIFYLVSEPTEEETGLVMDAVRDGETIKIVVTRAAINKVRPPDGLSYMARFNANRSVFLGIASVKRDLGAVNSDGRVYIQAPDTTDPELMAWQNSN